MTRQEVEHASVEWYRVLQEIRVLSRQHSEILSPMFQRAAQLENAYFAASRQLHNELDASRDTRSPK